MRRSQLASDDVMKTAMTQPKAMAQAPKKVKNITRSKLLGKQGRLHMPRQDLSQMATARMKAFRKRRPDDGAAQPSASAAVGGAKKKPRKE